MLEISSAKVAHVIIRAREYDAKVGAWEDVSPGSIKEYDANSILEDLAEDPTRSELATFIAGLNDDEQANLVALVWVGRETYAPEDFDEAVAAAKAERITRTENYLLGIPLLADYLEEAMEKLGYSLEDIQEDLLKGD